MDNQDHSSRIQFGGGAQACILSSALHAELTACLLATKMAIKRGFSRLLLYSECSTLVRLLSGSDIPSISVSWLVMEIRDLLHSLARVSICKAARTLISPAHDLATSARRRELLRLRF